MKSMEPPLKSSLSVAVAGCDEKHLLDKGEFAVPLIIPCWLGVHSKSVVWLIKFNAAYTDIMMYKSHYYYVVYSNKIIFVTTVV